MTISGQVVTHKPCPTCKLESAHIRDWTSGACCRRQLVEPYYRYAKNVECSASGYKIGYRKSLDLCAQSCRGMSVFFIYGSSSARCSGIECRCWCETKTG